MIRINPNSNEPVFQQIISQLKAMIARGTIRPGEAIPSVRQTAADALVNPNTVAKAYRELEREGILETRRGRGMFVAESANSECQEERVQAIRQELEEVVEKAMSSGITSSELQEMLNKLCKERKRKA